MSDASSPQVRDHETREGRERAEPRGSEMADEARQRYRPVNERERDNMGPARRGMAEGKGPSRGGRRSNEPTSHGVVPTRAPSRFFLLLSRCLPRECLALLVSLFFSLLGVVASRSAARLSPAVLLALILFIFPRSCSSTMWFDDLRSRRSSLRLLPYGRARNRPRCLAKLFDGKLHRRLADLPFRNRLGESRQVFCRALS